MNIFKRTKRAIRHFWQRHTRGFDDSVTWSLDWEFQKWILPRLIRYRELADRTIIIQDDYREALNDMIEGLSTEIDPCDGLVHKKLQKAYDQFAKWYKALWW